MHVSLTAKLSIAVALVLAFGLGLVGYLNYAKFAKSYAALERARFEAIGADLRSAIEGGMNLGIPLSALENVGRVIERAADTHAEAQAILVRRPQADGISNPGGVMFSVGEKAQARIPEEMLTSIQTGRDTAFLDEADQGAIFVSTPLTNAIGRVEGVLTIRYDRTVFAAALTEVRTTMLVMFGGLVGLIAIVTAAVVRWTSKGLSHSLGRMVHALEDGGQNLEEDLTHSDMEKRLLVFRRKSHVVQDKLDDLERRLDKSTPDGAPTGGQA